MNTPNKLTILRMVMVPVFVLLMMFPFPGSNWVALVIFVAASVTDFIDGYLARKHNQVTNFGKFMDPLADKLLVTAAILLFVEFGQCPAWCALIIIAREFAVTALRLIAVNNGIVIAAAWSGKIKTASSIVAICLMLSPWHDFTLAGSFDLDALCVLVMTVLTVWSGVEYFVKNKVLFSADKMK